MVRALLAAALAGLRDMQEVSHLKAAARQPVTQRDGASDRPSAQCRRMDGLAGSSALSSVHADLDVMQRDRRAAV